MATINTDEFVDLSGIQATEDNAKTVNVVVEMPYGNGPGKYEFDEDTGKLVKNRDLQTELRYPINYGFVPHTLAGDGDPIDVLLATDMYKVPDAPSVHKVRPVGVMRMHDEHGQDDKIIAVPDTPDYQAIKTLDDLDGAFRYADHTIEEIGFKRAGLKKRDGTDIAPTEKVPLTALIKHFFENYKKAEGQDVTVGAFEGATVAQTLIRESVQAYKDANPELGAA